MLSSPVVAMPASAGAATTGTPFVIAGDPVPGTPCPPPGASIAPGDRAEVCARCGARQAARDTLAQEPQMSR